MLKRLTSDGKSKERPITIWRILLFFHLSEIQISSRIKFNQVKQPSIKCEIQSTAQFFSQIEEISFSLNVLHLSIFACCPVIRMLEKKTENETNFERASMKVIDVCVRKFRRFPFQLLSRESVNFDHLLLVTSLWRESRILFQVNLSFIFDQILIYRKIFSW